MRDVLDMLEPILGGITQAVLYLLSLGGSVNTSWIILHVLRIILYLRRCDMLGGIWKMQRSILNILGTVLYALVLHVLRSMNVLVLNGAIVRLLHESALQ